MDFISKKKDTERKRILVIKNYIYNVIYQILTLVLPLITTPYISRVIGADGIGSYSFTQSIVSYFALFGVVGLNVYGQREIAYYQNDKEKRSEIFKELLSIRVITVGISMIVYFFFAMNSQDEYKILYYIQYITLVETMIDISWFFQGMEEFKKILYRNLIVKIITTIGIFLIVKEKSDLYIYVLLLVLGNFFGNASMWLYLKKYISKTKLKREKLARHFKGTLILFIPQIAIQIYSLLDRTMLGIIGGSDAEIGYYAQAQKIIRMALTVVTSLGVVMLPRISNEFAKNNTEKIREYLNKSFRFVFFLGCPIMFGLIGISNSMVPWFFGDGYNKVVILMQMISPIILFMGITGVIGNQYLLPTKKQKEYTISVVLGAVINLIFNLFLIPGFGAIGASIGTVMAELSVLIMQVIFINKEMKFKGIIKENIRYLLGGSIMMVVVLLLDGLKINDFVTTCIQITIGIVIYILYLIVIKDSFFGENIKKLFKNRRKC